MTNILNNNCEIVYSKRKTISICITKELKVIVRVPVFMGKQEIDIFINKYQNWIEKNLDKMKKRTEHKKTFSFSDTEPFLFFGEMYIIAIRHIESPVKIEDNYFVISDKVLNRQAAVIKFLKKKANDYLLQRVICFSNIMNVKPLNIKITSAKTRWGSCSGKNNICFSYRVMCLTPDIIDYIVVHELAHIKQHNHSIRFYNEILKVMPDYKKRVLELKKLQKQMMI